MAILFYIYVIISISPLPIGTEVLFYSEGNSYLKATVINNDETVSRGNYTLKLVQKPNQMYLKGIWDKQGNYLTRTDTSVIVPISQIILPVLTPYTDKKFEEEIFSYLRQPSDTNKEQIEELREEGKKLIKKMTGMKAIPKLLIDKLPKRQDDLKKEMATNKTVDQDAFTKWYWKKQVILSQYESLFVVDKKLTWEGVVDRDGPQLPPSQVMITVSNYSFYLIKTILSLFYLFLQIDYLFIHTDPEKLKEMYKKILSTYNAIKKSNNMENVIKILNETLEHIHIQSDLLSIDTKKKHEWLSGATREIFDTVITRFGLGRDDGEAKGKTLQILKYSFNIVGKELNQIIDSHNESEAKREYKRMKKLCDSTFKETEKVLNLSFDTEYNCYLLPIIKTQLMEIKSFEFPDIKLNETGTDEEDEEDEEDDEIFLKELFECEGGKSSKELSSFLYPPPFTDSDSDSGSGSGSDSDSD